VTVGRPLRPRPRRGADLHVHTTHSDGVLTPGDVVRAAATVGLSALAITDHDTLSALPSAGIEAERLGIELVPGVELSAEAEGREVHILAYFVRPDDPALNAALAGLGQARRERFAAMVGRLNGLGFRVDAESIRRAFPRALLGRRHLAEWLVRGGQVRSVREVFAGPLADDGPAHVRKPLPAVEQVIALARGAGGVAGLAHPPYDRNLRWLEGLAGLGLGALEVRGPGVPPARSRRLREWAEALGLVPIAGSDFHAPDRPGRWVGAITTPEADFERLRAGDSRFQ
jgi:predicted metal-dependent phosphoesterase TrpH